MKTPIGLLQWLWFLYCVPTVTEETKEEWLSLNHRPHVLKQQSRCYRFCGITGIETTFKRLDKPDLASLLLLHGVRHIVAKNPKAGALTATRIAEWFQKRDRLGDIPDDTKTPLIEELIKLFTELKTNVSTERRVATWLLIMRHFPELAQDQNVPFEVGRLTRGDSEWLPSVYAILKRPEPPQAEGGEPTEAAAAPTISSHQVGVENAYSSILAFTAIADLSVPELTTLAFRHPNPKVRSNALEAMSGLEAPLGRDALLGALTEDQDLTVRLHCATLLEGMGTPLYECIPPLFDLYLDAPKEQLRLLERFIVSHDVRAISGLALTLNQAEFVTGIPVVNLLYNIFKNSRLRKENPQELIAALKPYTVILSSLLPLPWINSWTAGRLAYMIAVTDKSLLLPPPPQEVA